MINPHSTQLHPKFKKKNGLGDTWVTTDFRFQTQSEYGNKKA